MEVALKRFSDSGESTLGLFYIDNQFIAFTLEDTYREVKKIHETCVPTGRYRILYNENVTPMTTKYRKRYSFFKYHLELQNVPYFKNIYIHSGNTKDHTSGCILTGNTCTTNADRNGFIGDSRSCFTKVYKTISDALDDKLEVFINISEVFSR